jgi:hypothetical protein
MTAKATHPCIHIHLPITTPRNHQNGTLLRSLAAQLSYFCCKQQSTTILYSPPLVVHQVILVVFQTVGFIQDVVGD